MLAPDDPRHGTKAAYDRHACRCRPCRMANAAWQKQYRRQSVERRRAIGERTAALAARWLRGHQPEVYFRLRDEAQRSLQTRPTQRRKAS